MTASTCTEAQEYVDKVWPNHTRRSCLSSSGEPTLYNAKYAADDFTDCPRCTLLHAILLASLDDVLLK